MRCKSCNKIFGAYDWTFEPETQTYNELCFSCSQAADIALFELEEKDYGKGNTSPSDT